MHQQYTQIEKVSWWGSDCLFIKISLCNLVKVLKPKINTEMFIKLIITVQLLLIMMCIGMCAYITHVIGISKIAPSRRHNSHNGIIIDPHKSSMTHIRFKLGISHQLQPRCSSVVCSLHTCWQMGRAGVMHIHAERKDESNKTTPTVGKQGY